MTSLSSILLQAVKPRALGSKIAVVWLVIYKSQVLNYMRRTSDLAMCFMRIDSITMTLLQNKLVSNSGSMGVLIQLEKRTAIKYLLMQMPV